MTNTAGAKNRRFPTLLAVALSLATLVYQPAVIAKESTQMTVSDIKTGTLSAQQQALITIASLAAGGDIKKLNPALEEALDAGLTVNEAKEVLVQVYAYAGFPRSLNALGELMKVTEARTSRGVHDAPGREPSQPSAKGDALLKAGTVNQTKLVGAHVKGPLFEFAPVIDEYLKTHLFGDIFERDNLSWQERELATVSMLAAIPGVQSQLQSHLRISLNVGLTEDQLRALAQVLDERADPQSAKRANEALAAIFDENAKP